MSLVAEASKYLSRAVGFGLGRERVDVEVVRDGDDGWRVSRKDPEQSPFALLGFVTLVDGAYCVRSVARPLSPFETDSLAEAVDALRPAELTTYVPRGPLAA